MTRDSGQRNELICHRYPYTITLGKNGVSVTFRFQASAVPRRNRHTASLVSTKTETQLTDVHTRMKMFPIEDITR